MTNLPARGRATVLRTSAAPKRRGTRARPVTRVTDRTRPSCIDAVGDGGFARSQSGFVTWSDGWWASSWRSWFLEAGAYYYLHEDPLRTELDRRWPPVTPDQQRQAAVDSAASALKSAGRAERGGRGGRRDDPGDRARRGQVEGRDQAAPWRPTASSCESTADFDVTLTPDDLPKDFDKRTLVAALAPPCRRTRSSCSSRAAASVSDARQRALLIKLLPAVSRVRIDKLTVKGSYDVTAAADAIALLLDRYADNLSAALSASPVHERRPSGDPPGRFRPVWADQVRPQGGARTQALAFWRARSRARSASGQPPC